MIDDILEKLLSDFEQCQDDLLGADSWVLAMPELENSVLGVLFDLYMLEKNNTVGAAITINGEKVSEDKAHDIISIMHYNRLLEAVSELIEGAE